MKNVMHFSLAFGLIAGTVSNLSAQTIYNWTGDGASGSSQQWTNVDNWSTGTEPNSTTNADVRVETNKGLVNGYSMGLLSSRGFKTMYVDLERFALVGGNRTMRIGNGGGIHFSNRYTANEQVFSSTSITSRLWLSSLGNLTLRNDGSGTIGFNFANLQNDNNASTLTDSVFTFEGTGNWLFGANSYLGQQRIADGGERDILDKTVSVATGSSFSGTVTYDATRLANLNNLTLNGGTLVVNTGMNLTGSALVDSGATLAGSGHLAGGSVLVNGNLRTALTGAPASLSIRGADLTLSASSSLALRVLAPDSADSILGEANGADAAGILTLGGTLVIDATGISDIINGVTLYSGFSGVAGDFTSVLLNGTSLQSQGGGLWSGTVGGYIYDFDSATGILNSGVVPEPATVVAVFGAVALGVVVIRRRRARV